MRSRLPTFALELAPHAWTCSHELGAEGLRLARPLRHEPGDLGAQRAELVDQGFRSFGVRGRGDLYCSFLFRDFLSFLFPFSDLRRCVADAGRTVAPGRCTFSCCRIADAKI